MYPLVILLSGILGIVIIRMIVLEKDFVKLKQRNRLLCRDNHKLRIKLKEHEDSSKR